MGKCLGIEDVIKKHEAIMDKADPKKQIGLLVDEWGTWWDEEPGTIKGHLYQQNSMRDASWQPSRSMSSIAMLTT